MPTYGDGSPIATADLELVLDLAEEMQVDIEWQKGDIVLIDNYAVMHSRKPWTGQRVILAALWDQGGRIKDYEEDKAHTCGKEGLRTCGKRRSYTLIGAVAAPYVSLMLT